MIIGVVKETYPNERRVALVPALVPPLTKAKAEVILETGAGLEAGYTDAAYHDRGARIVASREVVLRTADVLLQVRTLGANPDAGRADLALFREGLVVIGMAEPLTAGAEAKAVADTGATLFAMELIPRITRAQSMDVLSSMASIAGYKAALLAASTLPRMFPMLMTAAGTITPARVFVVGAGVAGLQAIAFARKLGAVVEAYDVRPAVKEQVQSLGAKFVELPLETGDHHEDEGGYAREQDELFYMRQREMMAKVVASSDVVLTTAAVPGKRAPVLITAEMVRSMPVGSVVVDLAAERGGNCEITRPGETVVEHGVTVVGPVNLPATVPYHASQMYAKNISSFLLLLLDKEGQLSLNLEDEIVRETLVARDGKVVHPKVLALVQPDAAAHP